MSRAPCDTPIAPAALLQYWVRELSETEGMRLEEHLLGCDECSATLRELVELGEEVRDCAGRGLVQAVVTDVFVWRLAARGRQLRQYRVPRDGSVHCTIAPGDDVAIARLEAPLAGVERLDLVILAPDDERGEVSEVLEDVPFDADAGEVVLAPDTARLRALPATTVRMQLVAVEGDRRRRLGEYTFIHTPWEPM